MFPSRLKLKYSYFRENEEVWISTDRTGELFFIYSLNNNIKYTPVLHRRSRFRIQCNMFPRIENNHGRGNR